MGLTHVQFVLLAGLGFLQEKQSLTTQARLANFCRTDPMMTSQVVRVLERDGKLIRRPHPNDSRAKVLELTDAGVALLNQAMPAVLEADQQFFSSLTAGHGGFVHQLRTLLVEPEDQDEDGTA